MSVSKKIWGLLLGVMVLTLLAGFSMTGYLIQQEESERAQALDYDHRIRLAVQWRGVTDTAIANVVLGAMTTEEELSRLRN